MKGRRADRWKVEKMERKPDITDNVMDAIVVLMDDDIRERVHGELAPCTNRDFLVRYCELVPEFEDVLNSEFGICI